MTDALGVAEAGDPGHKDVRHDQDTNMARIGVFGEETRRAALAGPSRERATLASRRGLPRNAVQHLSNTFALF